MATKKQGGRTTPSKAKSEVTDVQTWKKDKIGKPLDLPSGKTCLARTVSLHTFVAKGQVPNSLMPMITEALNEGKPPSAKELGNQVTAQSLAEMLELADAVVMEAVIQPPLSPPPADNSERRDDVLYVDEVDMDDKMFIFQWAVEGTRDLERFRSEQTAGMAAISSGENVESKAE